LQLLSLRGNGGQLDAESPDLLKQIIAVRPLSLSETQSG
jgi:hypothetical protein